jgi:hypothetical protein
MNALVASVIRTLVPVAVGQVASWFLLLHLTLSPASQSGLATFLGGALTAVYYVGVRVLEQQWPVFGVLLGLTKSPDTYSKDIVAGSAPTKTADPLASILTAAPAPATTFPAEKVAAVAPAVIEPDYTAAPVVAAPVVA